MTAVSSLHLEQNAVDLLKNRVEGREMPVLDKEVL